MAVSLFSTFLHPKYLRVSFYLVVNKLTPKLGSLCRNYSDGQAAAQNYYTGLFTKLSIGTYFKTHILPQNVETNLKITKDGRSNYVILHL